METWGEDFKPSRMWKNLIRRENKIQTAEKENGKVKTRCLLNPKV